MIKLSGIVYLFIQSPRILYINLPTLPLHEIQGFFNNQNTLPQLVGSEIKNLILSDNKVKEMFEKYGCLTQTSTASSEIMTYSEANPRDRTGTRPCGLKTKH